MTNRPPGSREHRRAPELRLPYPLLEYLLELPGDYAKLTLRLLQRAQWVPVVTQTGVQLDAGEILLSLRSRDLWGEVALDRQVDEAGRVSLLRRVLSRLKLDGFAVTRAAHDSDTPEGARSGTRRDTPATVVRFLKYRGSLWPANAGATHGTAHEPTHGTTHQTDTIPSRDPATPATQREAASDTRALASGKDESPRIGEVRAVLAMAGSAFAEILGAPYQHALPQALRADRRAAAELLAVPGADLETIESVWRWALRQRDWPRIETLADLAQHWVRIAPRAFAARASLNSRPATSPLDARSTCPEWEALACRLKQRLRPELFTQWFAPLSSAVDGGELVLHAVNDFHRAFLEDNYRAFIAEELERTPRSPALQGRSLGLRITAPTHSSVARAEP